MSKNSAKDKQILPGSTIGVLGGGQLGRMMALAGRAMGYRFVTLDPTEDCPCAQVADKHVVASYDDLTAAGELARLADVITYEFENVDAATAEMLMQQSYVPQGSMLLHTTQHRLREKQAIEAAGISVAPYKQIRSEAELYETIDELGLPCVLKTATGGYDGKGQFVIRNQDQITEAYQQLSTHGVELVLEKFIPFELEISVIAARNPSGELAVFPPAENVHVENILHLSIVPARVNQEIQQRAEAIAKTIAEKLGVVGLIAVEMFVTGDGEIFVNELAPRPHNSGHYTMEACVTSQFEQHVRAICNLPLGSTKLLRPAVMVNILGQHVEPTIARIADRRLAAEDEQAGLSVKLHLYGKHEAKPQRKMGHVNVMADSRQQAIDWIEATGIWEDKQ